MKIDDHVRPVHENHWRKLRKRFFVMTCRHQDAECVDGNRRINVLPAW